MDTMNFTLTYRYRNGEFQFLELTNDWICAEDSVQAHTVLRIPGVKSARFMYKSEIRGRLYLLRQHVSMSLYLGIIFKRSQYVITEYLYGTKITNEI
eukprot:jgi/Bigna1/143945/aug1.82_g18653